MKTTLRWLNDFVDLPTSDPAEIGAVFESLGFEVEEMTTVTPSFSGVVVGRVTHIEPHPNADKVRVCTVDVGSEVAEIICGAWNFDVGAVVPVALPGAVLGGDFEIGRREIRGVVSNGMICSEQELEVGDDHAGIMVLNEDYPAAESHLGDDFATQLHLPDTIYDLAVTPNRPDCMSVVGLARELAAYYDIPLRHPEVALDAEEPPSRVDIRIEDPIGCPRFVGREVRNITVGPSPHWIRARLEAAGVRPINNVVDASNYVMMELGHPTHAFDLERLGDQIVVRRATDGEALVTLDGVERELVATDIVVADATRAVAIAGVMGGADTEVHDDSRHVFVEAAMWEPPSVLVTSKRLGLRSEASARFERGMDPNFCHVAADRVAELLVEFAGGTAAARLVDAYPEVVTRRQVPLALDEIPRLLGIEIDRAAAAQLLRRLDFDVKEAEPLLVTVPTRRHDVTRPADLVEEIARLHGFDGIPDRVAVGPGGGLTDAQRRERRLREVMVGAGYHEALTFSFIGESDLDALALPEDDPRREGIRVVNPLRDEEGVMRTTLLPGILKAAAHNIARNMEDVRLFEFGKVFLPAAASIPDQPDMLAFVAAGAQREPSREDAGWALTPRQYEVLDATGLVSLIAEELESPITLRRAVVEPFHPERCAAVGFEGETIGHVGELRPSVADAFGLSGRVAIGEVTAAPMLRAPDAWQFINPSQFPPVIFDLAFEVADETPNADVLEAITTGAGELAEEVWLFDVFRGSGLGEGRKSMAYRLTLRAPERTLTDAEIAPVRARIEAAVADAVGGTLRGGPT